MGQIVLDPTEARKLDTQVDSIIESFERGNSVGRSAFSERRVNTATIEDLNHFGAPDWLIERARQLSNEGSSEANSDESLMSVVSDILLDLDHQSDLLVDLVGKMEPLSNELEMTPGNYSAEFNKSLIGIPSIYEEFQRSLKVLRNKLVHSSDVASFDLELLRKMQNSLGHLLDSLELITSELS